MTTFIMIALLVCILGGLVYLILKGFTRESVATLALASFCAGLLATLIIAGGKYIKF